jgi:hypothetical protein
MANAAASTRLSRFLFTRNHLNPGQRFRAFLPPTDLNLSVFDTEQMRESEIWGLANRESAERNQTLYGRADVQAASVQKVGLRVVIAEPPPRHRHIQGWPPADQKEDQKGLAMELAALSQAFAAA